MDSRQRQGRVRAEQTKLLYQHALRSIPFHLVAASVVAIAIWSHIPSTWLGGWWILIALATAVRVLHAHHHRESVLAAEQSERLRWQFCAGAGVSGVLWGIGYIVFASRLPFDYQALVVIALAGISAGGLVASYGVKAHFLSFIVPTLTAPGAYGLYEGTTVQLWISLLVVLFAVALVLAFFGYRQAIGALITSRLDNADLIDSLSASNAELTSANEQLEALSATDELTQIANRRHFDRVLQREWGRAQRNGAAITYIMVDVDHFKLYNDHYGHVQGDECLRRVAQAIDSVLRRPGDFIGRYGGEEFAVISPDTPIEGGEVLGQKIRAGVESLGLPHEASDTAAVVTVSVGVSAIVPKTAADIASLIQSADHALYAAKQHGRNCVVCAAPMSEALPANAQP